MDAGGRQATCPSGGPAPRRACGLLPTGIFITGVPPRARLPTMTPADWTAHLAALDVTLFTWHETDFTVSSILKLILSFVFVLWLSNASRRWVMGRALRHWNLDEGTRRSIGNVVHYAVLAIGLVLVLQNAGINLTALSVVAGAVGVGIGFGLQNLFSNLISGLIIMIERPVKIGDRVELGALEGQITDIGVRRTTVLTNDRVAILVPNQKFILDNVVNLTHRHQPVRLRVPVNVAAAHDPEQVRRELLAAVAGHEAVKAEPAPEVLITNPGGAATSYELAVWYDPGHITRQQLLSDLAFALLQRLRAAEIKTA